MATAIIIGTLVTLGALTGRAALKTLSASSKLKNSKFLRGGFEREMSVSEAMEILNLKGSQDLKQAHRKIMLLNHPDKGGSPYLASKINEAKELLENKH